MFFCLPWGDRLLLSFVISDPTLVNFVNCKERVILVKRELSTLLINSNLFEPQRIRVKVESLSSHLSYVKKIRKWSVPELGRNTPKLSVRKILSFTDLKKTIFDCSWWTRNLMILIINEIKARKNVNFLDLIKDTFLEFWLNKIACFKVKLNWTKGLFFVFVPYAAIYPSQPALYNWSAYPCIHYSNFIYYMILLDPIKQITFSLVWVRTSLACARA